MDETVTIVDCGLGNIGSVVNMCRKVGLFPILASEAADIQSAERIIVAGVGRFDEGMERLVPFVESLTVAVRERQVPTLGISLGAHLMTRGCEEAKNRGLRWIEGDTKRFKIDSLEVKVPHAGWKIVELCANHHLTLGLQVNARFYFDHSFHVVCDEGVHWLFAADCGYRFVAGFVEKNIAGVQFHPEKSHVFGVRLLSKFATWQPSLTRQVESNSEVHDAPVPSVANEY